MAETDFFDQESITSGLYSKQDAFRAGTFTGFYFGINYMMDFFQQNMQSTAMCKDFIAQGTIRDLPDREYQLNENVSFVYEYGEDRILATIPELQIYGEGDTPEEAYRDLQLELLDIADDLYDIPDSDLGENPLSWKRILHRILRKSK